MTGLEPLVTISVPYEHPVVAHLYAEHEADEHRMLLDLEQRPCLIEDVLRALEDLMVALRERWESS